ncbi:MAG: XTP/dITP diphosphatase [Chloroflexi bacterium]|nr:XTP/dITP diphosphatase [Chloroflexota bacterium]
MHEKLLVATHNQGKVKEFSEMLSDLQMAWLSLDDLGVTNDVEETGITFRDNAILKATAYAQETGLLTLADDSGLQVDALDGAPGVYTARYGGKHLTHAERYQYLLNNIKDVPWDARSARFRCVIVLVSPTGELLGEAAGACEGMIALAPAGDGGFGYDPVFYMPERDKTMAEVETAVKHQISHRGRAMKQIEPILRRYLLK